MNVYSIDVKIVATAYIKAKDEEEARRIFADNFAADCGGELPTSDGSDTCCNIDVTGRSYDDPELPDASLSPAITFYGAWDADDGNIELDLVEEDVAEEGADA